MVDKRGIIGPNLLRVEVDQTRCLYPSLLLTVQTFLFQMGKWQVTWLARKSKSWAWAPGLLDDKPMLYSYTPLLPMSWFWGKKSVQTCELAKSPLCH